jgi:hypothetical protein
MNMSPSLPDPVNNVFNLLRYPVTIKFEEEILRTIPSWTLEHFWYEFIREDAGDHPKYKRITPRPEHLHRYLNNITSMKHRRAALKRLRAYILLIEE